MIDDYLKICLLKANNNYRAIQILSGSKENLNDGVCINSHMCIERCLQSFLISKNIDFRPIYTLNDLQKICSQFDSHFNNFDLGNLSKLKDKITSEEELYFSSDNEAKKFYKTAVEVKDFVFKKLNVTADDLKL